MAEYQEWDINGTRTQILYIEKNTKAILFFSPGNPGLCGWYEEYLTNLPITVICAGYPGHATPNSKIFSLEDHIQHRLDCLEYILEKYPEKRILIGGHSLGVYLSLQLLDHSRVEKLIGLFPTIRDIGDTDIGKFVSVISHDYILTVILVLSMILSLFPKIFLSWLLKIVSGQSGRTLEATVDLVTCPRTIKHFMTLARIEMKEMGSLSRANLIRLRKHQEKIHFYYGTIDPFVPIDHYVEFKHQYPKGNKR